ncbi:MAG TPA: GTPase RsgA, partial [Gemmatimonadales bacterium]|nr:GTPase RsgA [Gemmatimonadales bacterium]
ADARGRHTTTRRELVLLPGGGLLIDTPGMRELQLTDADEGLLAAFADVEALAGSCAFRDCSHGPEPGCAVVAAVADGRLDAGRLEGYRKLKRELELLERRYDKRAQAEERRRTRVAGKALEKRLKEKRG